MKWFVGWDWRDDLAFKVFERSLRAHSTMPLEVIPIFDRELRKAGLYWRSYRVDRDGQMWDDRDGKPFSTAFSFTRFAVPLMCDYADEWVVFSDPDMLVRVDIAKLFDQIDKTKAVYCVKHEHHPKEESKIDGVLQQPYRRKNWSSLMVLNPSRCKTLTKYDLNNASGVELHSFTWIDDAMIGGLTESWNWLEGYSPPEIVPDIVHYTRGTPDFPGYENSAYADEWRSYLGVRKQKAA